MSTRNRPISKSLLPASLGQDYPSQYAPRPGSSGVPARPSGAILALGPPLSIREVAQAIGYSVWTVRQVLVQRGLPCFRSRPKGKLIFYSNLIADWIRQQQGGQSKTIAEDRSIRSDPTVSKMTDATNHQDPAPTLGLKAGAIGVISASVIGT
jgi:hypothetical protein